MTSQCDRSVMASAACGGSGRRSQWTSMAVMRIRRLMCGDGTVQDAAAALADGVVSRQRRGVEIGIRPRIGQEMPVAVLAADQHRAVLRTGGLPDGRRDEADGKADARPWRRVRMRAV